MQYISAKEASEKWNISQRRVLTLCSENRISGIARVGNMWLIPSDLDKPIDARTSPKRKVEFSSHAKPFVKWAGGKGQLLEDIRKHYPSELGKSIKKYIEPFIGGGAVLFDILSKYKLEEIYINDINLDLINLYDTIKNNLTPLLFLLSNYQDEYIPLSTEERKSYYTKRREEFNKIKLIPNSYNAEKAALFIFLNKTCFNGLYRVNKSGLYNVPMGDYKNPCICDSDNLLKVCDALQNVKMLCGSYLELEQFIDENTFVYIDPPYRPLNTTSNFTSYTEFEFNDKEQIELAKLASRIKAKNAKVLLSNSDPKNVNADDNFFEEIYSEFEIIRVSATRMINSKASSRGKITELLISNI